MLHIDIKSFSYKRGIPHSYNEHGGGFVFDCRFLPNPGREKQYRPLTGMDAPVIEYLEALPETDAFLTSVVEMLTKAIDVYEARSFDYFSISFGCTGGRHRSVYFAEQTAKALHKKYKANVTIRHLEHEKR